MYSEGVGGEAKGGIMDIKIKCHHVVDLFDSGIVRISNIPTQMPHLYIMTGNTRKDIVEQKIYLNYCPECGKEVTVRD
jgi:hypothetical protein